MIDEINQEIEKLEREWQKLRNAGKENPYNTSIYVQFRAIEEKVEQAKKDKKIIEEGLEELSKSDYISILGIYFKKLKNQNGKQ